jgi:hypothetical protein
MSTPHSRKIKVITFTLEGSSFECQMEKWKIVNNTADGDRHYTLCPSGEFREEPDPDWSLEVTAFADWRSGGFSDFLTANDQLWADFVLDHLPDIPPEHVRWTGTTKLKAPGVDGEARKTEMTDVKFPIAGTPVYLHL